jgi:phosphohistidine phosphatase
MKKLVLMRHGAALSILESGAAGDAGRKLSSEGKDQIRASAGRLKELGFMPDVIISSPFLRAVETADIAAGIFPAARRVKEPALASPASLTGILDAISSAAEGASSVLVAGHQPAMGALSGLLLNAPPPPFHTGSFAYLKLPGGPDMRGSELVELFTPEPI